jgi:multidrug efflux pump subunit AcrA (membrane-fusion protein)
MTARARRPRRSGLTWVALVLVVVAACLYFAGYFERLRKETYPPNAFHRVKRADMVISVAEDGALRALNETVVRSALEGLNRIIYLVPEGSYVEKGDLLVELDSSSLRDRFNEQELLYQERLFEMLQASENLKIQKSLAESEIKDAELQVENAQVDLEKYRDGDAPLLIKTVESRSGVLAEQVRIATERYARTEELFKSGNATKSELQADELSLKREQLALSQYQEDLRLIKKFDQPNQIRLLESEVEQTQAELGRLRHRTSNEIAQAEADLKTSQAALEVMEEALKTQQRRLENAKIFAPQNGLVVYSSVSPFQFAGEDERRRDEGRFRGGRGGRGGNDFGGGDFRGGGRRGGRSNSEGSSGVSGSGSSSGSTGSGGSSSSRGSSVAQTIASGNQRIASAISGTPETASGGGSGSGGSRSGSGETGTAGGGGGSGQGVSSPATAFATYPSMRPSSAFGASSASNAAASTATGSTSSSSSSSGRESTGPRFAGGVQLSGNQFGFRSSQSFRDFEFYGTPGFLEEGTMVRQRQELIRLPDVSKMLAEVNIPESRVRQVRAGMTAYVQVHNVPHHRFEGTLRRVALLPDSQASWMNPNAKLFPADILIEEEMPILKPGVSATVEIIITNLTQVLSVPIQTVALLGGENVCYVKNGSRVRPVPVTTGWYNDSFIEITSGLKEGDQVLLAPVSDEDIEEAAPGGETNGVHQTNEPPHAPPNGEFREPLPESTRRGDPSDSSRNAESLGPSRRSESFGPQRRGQPFDPSRDIEPPPGDSSRRREFSEPSRDGQEPSSEERRFRRRDRDSEGTNSLAPSERRRGRPGGRRTQNTEESPE